MSGEVDEGGAEKLLLGRLLRNKPDAGLELVNAVLAGLANLDIIAAALDSHDPQTRTQGLVALGDFSRLNGAIDRRIMLSAKSLLRDDTLVGGFAVAGFADDAIDDAIFYGGRRFRFFTLFPWRYLRFVRRASIWRVKHLLRSIISSEA